MIENIRYYFQTKYESLHTKWHNLTQFNKRWIVGGIFHALTIIINTLSYFKHPELASIYLPWVIFGCFFLIICILAYDGEKYVLDHVACLVKERLVYESFFFRRKTYVLIVEPPPDRIGNPKQKFFIIPVSEVVYKMLGRPGDFLSISFEVKGGEYRALPYYFGNK